MAEVLTAQAGAQAALQTAQMPPMMFGGMFDKLYFIFPLYLWIIIILTILFVLTIVFFWFTKKSLEPVYQYKDCRATGSPMAIGIQSIARVHLSQWNISQGFSQTWNFH